MLRSISQSSDMDWNISRIRTLDSYGDALPTSNLDYRSTIGYLDQGTTAPSLQTLDRSYLEPLPSQRAEGMHAMGRNRTGSYIDPGHFSQQGFVPTSHVQSGHWDQHHHFIRYSQAPMSLLPSTNPKSLPEARDHCDPLFGEQPPVRGSENAAGRPDGLDNQGTSPYSDFERSFLPCSGNLLHHSGPLGDGSSGLSEIPQQNDFPEPVPGCLHGQHPDSAFTLREEASISLFTDSDELRTVSQKPSMNECISPTDDSEPFRTQGKPR
jgi:hypothetical protein